MCFSNMCFHPSSLSLPTIICHLMYFFVLDIMFFIPWVLARALGWGRGNTSGCSGKSPARKKAYFGQGESLLDPQPHAANKMHRHLFSEKKKTKRARQRKWGRNFFKSSESPSAPFFFFCPLAMLRDGSFPENLNNGFGQHLLRAHWRPRIQQTQLPTVHKMSCISHGDSREQDENGGTDFAGFHSNHVSVCFMHEPPFCVHLCIINLVSSTECPAVVNIFPHRASPFGSSHCCDEQEDIVLSAVRIASNGNEAPSWEVIWPVWGIPHESPNVKGRDLYLALRLTAVA